MGEKHHNTIEGRTWLMRSSENNHISVYLVESPLTFGHSQLILTTKRIIPEEDMFGTASSVIKECLPIINEKLPKALENPTWKTLREYTKTRGQLVKNLILKVSANEAECQYKIHIVPYFESHLCLTNLLFQQGRDVSKSKTGGLIRWLGEQERKLDDQIEIWRDTCHFPTVLVESFELVKLAGYLKKEGVQKKNAS
jgi:hypothetical protein